MYWRWLQWWRPDSSFELAADHPCVVRDSDDTIVDCEERDNSHCEYS